MDHRDGRRHLDALTVPADPVSDAPAALDGSVFRRVIGNFMTGVVVITTEHDGARRGMTVSAVSSLSLDPPMLLVCLNAGSSTQEAVHRSGRFAVNILAEHQGPVAERFARPGSDDKFAGVATRAGRTGVPLLAGALATVECRVVEVVGGGTHRVFLADAVHAEAAGEDGTAGAPLAYFRGSFGKFEHGRDAAVYRRLRRMVLTRELGPDDPVEVADLATRLSAPPASVYDALTRLVGDGLVGRDPQRGYVVTPLDAATSDDAHDAQLALELGAAELVADRLTAAQLAELRELAQATGAQLSAGRFADVAGYIDANQAFHRFLVDATGVRALAQAYEQLSVPDLMAQALLAGGDAGHLAQDHVDLVDALERRDLPAVRRVLTAHTERAKATQRAGILRAGGRV